MVSKAFLGMVKSKQMILNFAVKVLKLYSGLFKEK